MYIYIEMTFICAECQKVTGKSSRNVSKKYTFTERTVDLRNFSPAGVVKSLSADGFKRTLDKFSV